MINRSRLIGALAAVLLLALSSMVWAQTTGRIQGQVVDVQAAAIPGATVTVTSPALQGALTQVSDAEGRFRFPSVPPGGTRSSQSCPTSRRSSRAISRSASTGRRR